MNGAADRVAALRASPAYAELLAVSARLGQDPLQVQGPGGNTSLKADGVMLVKASGTLLADAEAQDIMVPVDAAGLRAALSTSTGVTVEGRAFTLDSANPHGLRPSIETAVHAVLDWPVVLHTHCVATIAAAVRSDAEAFVQARLAGLDAAFVAYVKPGEDLARAILDAVTPATTVIILGNHGLAVCARTPAEAETLVYDVARRLEPPAAQRAGPTEESSNGPPDGVGSRDGAVPAADTAALGAALEGSGWRAVDHPPTQAVALEAERWAIAAGATLYPDHAIFLGPGVVLGRADEPVPAVLARAAATAPSRKLVLLEGRGAVIPADASPSVVALARAFGDVLARIDPAAALTRLTAAQEAELLEWDAEKYRQSLEQARTAGDG